MGDSIGWWLGESLDDVSKGFSIGDGRRCNLLSMVDEEEVWLCDFEAKGNVNSSNTTCHKM